MLYVAYAAQAEWGAFLSLGWTLPIHVLDLFAEFRCHSNGLSTIAGLPVESSLIAALRFFELESMTFVEKQMMRNLILRGHPFSAEEQGQILDYCAEDVAALARLFPVIMNYADIPYAIFRGR